VKDFVEREREREREREMERDPTREGSRIRDSINSQNATTTNPRQKIPRVIVIVVNANGNNKASTMRAKGDEEEAKR